MAEVYSFTNDEVSIEIRASGKGMHGFWVIQKAPKVELARAIGLVMCWFPSPKDAVESIACGHVYRCWDGKRLVDCGVPKELSDWRCFQNEVGALD